MLLRRASTQETCGHCIFTLAFRLHHICAHNAQIVAILVFLIPIKNTTYNLKQLYSFTFMDIN